MKRYLTLLLALALLFALPGCGKTQEDSGKLKVVASAFPEYDFVRAVGGDRVELTLLLKPGTEAHSFEPTPQDVLSLHSAALFVYGGGESDVWADRMLSSGELANLKTLSMMDYALLYQEETQSYMTLEEAEEEDGEAYDEHVWTSPVNAVSIVAAVRDTLTALDPEGADYYASRALDYTAQLTQLDAAFRTLVSEAQRDLLVFGDRFPFLYLTREYGLRYAAAFPGCSGDTDANPSTVAYLIDLCTEQQIPVVFKCDLSAGKLADTIAEAAGAKVLTLYSVHTVSKADFDAGETYLTLMNRNLIALQEALN